ncbi:MAG: helix-turn-helix domain-containing protein [Betaproteobacteria bacterium]|nr:helix-turn-helix domain-containing protein [Betaproteobacteria bacterium]
MPKPLAPSTPVSPAAPTDVASTEVRPKARRRTFSTRDKLRILRAADKCIGRGELGALLRREGIYHSMLDRWRKQFAEQGEQGLQRRRGPKSAASPQEKEIQRLSRELQQRDAEIGRLHELLALQKKVLALVDAAQKLVH